MPLPQKVVEQLGREPARTPGWSGRLLMSTSTIFFVVLVIYLGMQFGYRPYLDGQVRALEAQITELTQKISAENQETTLSFYGQLANMKDLLDGHVHASNFFVWLEANTNTGITFSSLDFRKESDSSVFTLEGSVLSIQQFTEQMLHFESLPEVERAQFDSLKSAEGTETWDFSIELVMDPSFISSVSYAPTFSDETQTIPAESDASAGEPISGEQP